jgi:hypothetical protein
MYAFSRTRTDTRLPSAHAHYNWYALSSSPSSRGVNINYRTAATPTAHNQCFDRTALGHDHLDLQLEMPGHAPASKQRASAHAARGLWPVRLLTLHLVAALSRLTPESGGQEVRGRYFLGSTCATSTSEPSLPPRPSVHECPTIRPCVCTSIFSALTPIISRPRPSAVVVRHSARGRATYRVRYTLHHPYSMSGIPTRSPR